MSDSDFPSPDPFWFVSSEVSMDLLRTEISKIKQLIEQHPQVRNIFDNPEASESERRLCFALLVHHRMAYIFNAKIGASYEPYPSLNDDELKVVSSIDNFVPCDGPNWIEEMNRIIEQLPSHLFAMIPSSLHVGRFTNNDPAQSEIIESAAKTLSSVEHIQSLIERVLDQQWERLAKRWSLPEKPPEVAKRPRNWSKGISGLTRKADLSQYKHGLTEKQELAFSLKWEYQVRPAEIAARMGLDRKTAYEHIKTAESKIEQFRSNEKRKELKAKNNPE